MSVPLIDENFSLVPSVGQSILSFDEFTFIRTITNNLLRSLEDSVMNRICANKLDVDHIALLPMKPGESVSLMYWMHISEYLADWDLHVDNVENHVRRDASRLNCRIQKDKASADDILEYANEWPTDSLDQKLIYAAGTATCIGSIAQLVSFGLLHEEILLCEQHKESTRKQTTAMNVNNVNPLMTRIYEYGGRSGEASKTRLILFDASKVLSCCKITRDGAIEYGSCSMHVFRDPEDSEKMILIADILRVPPAPAGSHTFLSPRSVCSLSEIMFDSIQDHFKDSPV